MNTGDQHTPHAVAPAHPQHTLPVILLGDLVILPRPEPVVLHIERNPSARSYCAMEAALAADGTVLLIMVAAAMLGSFHGTEPPPLPICGVLAQLALPDSEALPQGITVVGDTAQHGTITVAVTSVRRVLVTVLVQDAPFRRATWHALPDTEPQTSEAHALVRAVQAHIATSGTLLPDHAPEVEVLACLHQIAHPGELADWVAHGPAFTLHDRFDLLNMSDPLDRLRKVQSILSRT